MIDILLECSEGLSSAGGTLQSALTSVKLLQNPKQWERAVEGLEFRIQVDGLSRLSPVPQPQHLDIHLLRHKMVKLPICDFVYQG